MVGRGKVELGVGGDQHRRAAVLDGEAPDLPVGDERVDGLAHPGGSSLEAPVLDDPGLRECAAGPNGAHGELAQALGLGRRRRIEDLARQNARREVVEPLEPLSPCDHQFAVVPEQLEHLLRRLPSPHLPLPRGAVEMPRAQGAAGGDLLEDVLAQVRVRPVDGPVPPAAPHLHRRPEEPPVLRGQEARFVGPVLDQPAPPEQPRDGRGRICADAPAEGDPVAPLDGRDGVELHAREPPHGGVHLGGRASPAARGVALRDDRESANRGRRDAHAPHVCVLHATTTDAPVTVPGCDASW